MKDTYIAARLVSPDTIRFVSLSDVNFNNEMFFLLIDKVTKIRLYPIKNVSTPSHVFIEFKLAKPLELGHSYYIYIPLIGMFPLDVTEATTFANFDKKYYYDGQLGAIYRKDKTTWKVWAPLASSVKLQLINNDKETLYDMKRQENGIFSLTLDGDFKLQRYKYLVTNSEISVSSIDPYGKSSTVNAKESVVIDESIFEDELNADKLPPFSGITQAIIYEGNVRDLTIDKHSTIKNKGKYLGLTEKGKKTKGGNPIGLDYLKWLGISHLQLQPLNDFGSVNEEKGFEEYNWGYDPIQYFAPEGSYSTDPYDPMSRVNELQKMISSIHNEGIRVVLDVVFNHVYESAFSSFEAIVPNYYFRKSNNGKLTNSSGCGDDVASEKPMVRKLIIDSCLFWQKAYKIDGLRFDLMGLLDGETIKELDAKTKEVNPSFIIYGEGWNMYVPRDVEAANMNNSFDLPKIGFFNDFYRENVKQYCTGDLGKKNAFIYSLLGSCHDWDYKFEMFKKASQSINYIECHDNGTFFDHLLKNTEYSDEEKLEIVKFSVTCVLFSFGVPFIHMGQEIGQSKYLKDNTYNAGDIYNKLSDNLLDERFQMVEYVRGAITLRKALSIFKETDPSKLAALINFEEFDGGLIMKVKDTSQTSPCKEIDFIFNPTSEALTYSFDDDHYLIFTSGGGALDVNVLAKNVLIPRHSLIITALKK